MMIHLKRDDCRAGDKNRPYIGPMAAILSIFIFMTNGTGAFAFVSTIQYLSHNWICGCTDFNQFITSSTRLHMGRKVTIRIVGRKQGGEEWLEEACEMYLKRLKPTGFEVSTEWFKTNDALLKVHHDQSSSQAQTKHVPIVLLDPTGIRCTSEVLTDKIYQWLQEGGSRLVFVIGGGTKKFYCSTIGTTTVNKISYHDTGS